MKKIFLAAFLSITFASITFTGAFSHADDKKMKSSKASTMEWTTVQRENMAKMHESMATCLRSTKTMKDCRAEMKTSCTDMGKDACPMMQKGHHGMMSEEY